MQVEAGERNENLSGYTAIIRNTFSHGPIKSPAYDNTFDRRDTVPGARTLPQGRRKGMLLGEEKDSTVGQQPVDLSEQLVKILHIMYSEGAEHHVKRAVQSGEVAHTHADKGDAFSVIFRLCNLEHFFGEVQTRHMRRAQVQKFPAILPVTAAQIQDPLAGQVWAEGKERRFFHKVIGSGWLLPQLPVTLKKDLIIIDVLIVHGGNPILSVRE